MAELGGRFGAAVIFGAIGATDLGGANFDYFNSAFYVDQEGREAGRFDKIFLVPIVERVPFVNPEIFRQFQYFGGFSVGDRARTFSVNGQSFGVLICYESIFTQLSREYRREGATFLVNITNDAWFGREHPWWSRSSALSQHPAHLVMRAIENRVGIARSGNTGVSGIVDPLGRWQVRTALFTHDVFAAQVETTEDITLFARFGDIAGWTAALLGLAAIVLAGVTKRGEDQP
jgi:apolipoprotein N-acyltransferase